jgi:DNA topoisomerase VI subunit B
MTNANRLERTTFTTSRLLEFFTVEELRMQIGHGQPAWPVALLKELVDNALDACEAAGIAPEITVTVTQDSFAVQDNGPGLPAATLKRSLDYTVRVSDKAHYVAPTRGQLGNALKCLWAAPFVATGQQGQVEVTANGQKHIITVGLDHIAQRPALDHTTVENGTVKNGTSVQVHWPQVASYLDGTAGGIFYKASPNHYDCPTAETLLRNYAALNSHVTFTYIREGRQPITWHSSDPACRKWTAGDKTSPHWYTPDRLRGLIAAYIAAEREGGRALSVRDFVAEFRGCSATGRLKEIVAALSLARAPLAALVANGDVDQAQVSRLLQAMQGAVKPVKPETLGVIGEKHLRQRLAACCAEETIAYRAARGLVENMPYVLELAFGVRKATAWGARDVVAGINWTPTIQMPVAELHDVLGAARVDLGDPIVLLVHLATPRVSFTDRGKGRLALPEPIADAITKAARAVTAPWTKAKRTADREGRVRERELAALYKSRHRERYSIKEAAYEVMEQAYMAASADNTLPANARQIMYAARPAVLKLTGGNCWKNSSYFTQVLLPEFMDEHPDLTANWDVVYDARGKLVEPHTDKRIDLGTLAVRGYVAAWHEADLATLPTRVEGINVLTCGPHARYRYALFVEKEGFNSLFAKVRLAERYDMAIMSTKGMSVTAARQLIERLSEQGVTILVLRDFDKAGFSIVSTLRGDTRRWRYGAPPKVIDLGLRLTDVQAMGLQSEPVEYESKVDPRWNLAESGATPEECDYLVEGLGRSGKWRGERVELNAMASSQLVAWLEDKLTQAGVAKLVPDAALLQAAYARAVKLGYVQQALDQALKQVNAMALPAPPEGLPDLVAQRIEGQTLAWDDAIEALAIERIEELERLTVSPT